MTEHRRRRKRLGKRGEVRPKKRLQSTVEEKQTMGSIHFLIIYNYNNNNGDNNINNNLNCSNNYNNKKLIRPLVSHKDIFFVLFCFL